MRRSKFFVCPELPEPGTVGPIVPGDRIAHRWAFTRKRWTEASYLFLEQSKGRVMLSSVQATNEGRGYLRDLIRAIEQSGRRVAVPGPLDHMEEILRHYGFIPRTEAHELGEPVDVWERPR